MGFTNPFAKKLTLDEAQEENERLDTELSIEQKRAAIKKLKAAGLTAKSFGFDWRAIRNWIKTHG